MYPLPLTNANLTGTYASGSVTALVFTNCVGIGVVAYTHAVLSYAGDELRPSYAVASEDNQLAAHMGGGSHFLCAYDHGHENYGSSDDWADSGKFTAKALDMIAQHYKTAPFQQVAFPKPGDEPLNLSRVLAVFEMGASLASPQRTPLLHAMALGNVGSYHYQLARFIDPADHLHQAVQKLQQASEFMNPQAAPPNLIDLHTSMYARTQSNLAQAYGKLAALEDKAGNLHRAISAWEEALRYLPNDPYDRAMTQVQLGVTWYSLSALENKADYLHRALKLYDEALRYATGERDKTSYAGIQNNRGMAYRELASIEDRENNLRQAVVCWQEAEPIFRKNGDTRFADRLLQWIAEVESL